MVVGKGEKPCLMVSIFELTLKDMKCLAPETRGCLQYPEGNRSIST